MENDSERWAAIGQRAAKLCYAENSGGACHNHCVGSCSAVCPFEHLLLAADEIFKEYWADHNARYQG